jgi:hypothetical protein
MTDCGAFSPSSTKPDDIHNQLLESYKDSVKRPSVQFQIAEDATLDSNSHVPVAQLQAKYQLLQDGGFVSSSAPSGLVTTTNVESQIQLDRNFVIALHNEFCHYYSRFVYALDRFIYAVTGNTAAVTTQAIAGLLNDVRTLNVRCIYIIEFSNYVAQKRIPPAQADAKSIQDLNAALNGKLQRLQNANEKFKDDRAIVTTQQEMVRYTASKNAATMGTITGWITTNVLAVIGIGAAYFFL